MDIIVKDKDNRDVNYYIGRVKRFLKNQKVRNSIIDTWKDLMVQKSLFNLQRQTFGLNNLILENYGYTAIVKIPVGFIRDNLEDISQHIEAAYGCRCILAEFDMSDGDMTKKSFVKIFLIKAVDMGRVFTKVKLDSTTEIYIGNDFVGNPIKLDFYKSPSMLNSGAPRCGKTKQITMALYNLSLNFTKREVGFYLIQVSRSDLLCLADNKNTIKFVKQDYEEILETLYEISKEYDRRDKLISPYIASKKATNFKEYNKVVRESERFQTIYLVVDELASIVSKGDNATRTIRENINRELSKMASKGAMLGIFSILSLQRPDANSMDTVIKSCCDNIISFRANNSKSSEVAIDDPTVALGLEQREFVYRTGKNFSYGVVPYFDF